jgi:hypothetical protein
VAEGSPAGEIIQAGRTGTGTPFRLRARDAAKLSKPDTDAGKLQRAMLALYREHRDDGALPTGGRFLWYELEQRGVVDKTKARGHPGVTGRGVDQYVSEALLRLREVGLVPWADIVDDTRDTSDFTGHPTVLDGVRGMLDDARLDPWDDVTPPPLVLCESRQTAAVLTPVVYEHRALISGLGGQVHGHLVVNVVPYLRDNLTILWLGDRDLSGDQIQANAHRVLGQHNTADDVTVRRVALTQAQVDESQRDPDQPTLEPIRKRDNRYSDGRPHLAVELEALGQQRIVALVRDALDDLLPDPLDDVRVREREEQDALRAILDREAS